MAIFTVAATSATFGLAFTVARRPYLIDTLSPPTTVLLLCYSGFNMIYNSTGFKKAEFLKRQRGYAGGNGLLSKA